MTELMIGRRHLLAGAASLAALSLAGCSTTGQTRIADEATRVPPDVAAMYAAVPNDRFPIPAARMELIEPEFWRQVVDDPTGERPGTLVVDTAGRHLYLVQEGGKAMRYGVGVAKSGLEYQGDADILRKASWPGWTPTPDMIKREPDRYQKLAGGMEGGLKNPLGARALYLYRNGQDTLYRIHGTNEPWSIGKSVSSGCIRLLNQDIIDLHKRVPKGSRVVVLGPEQSGKGEI